MRTRGIFLAVTAALGAIAVLFTQTSLAARQMPGYQAVLLDNNQVYYGKLAGLGTPFPVMTDVFYFQAAVNPQTKQQSNVLVKRGNEGHGPEKTVLNAQHILMVEPVTPGSPVANLINQANRK
jgi:hypothetical protein